MVASTFICASATFAQSNSYSNSEECGVVSEQQSKAWDKAYSEHWRCWADSKCGNPGSEPRFKVWSQQLEQLRDDCKRMALIERTNKQAAYEASRHVAQEQSQVSRTRVIKNQAYVQQQAENAQDEKRANQKAVAGALMNIFNSVTSSKRAQSAKSESAAVERYQAQQEEAERIHKEAQRNQDAVINEIQNEQWKRVKEQNTKTVSQIDALERIIDSIEGDDNPWAARATGSTPARPNGPSTRGAVLAANPWAATPSPPIPTSDPPKQVEVGGNGPSGEQNPWTESERVAMNDKPSPLDKPLAPGMVFYRDIDSGSLRAVRRTEVKSARGDTDKRCSIDGIGIVLARCESQRQQKRAS
jgi:hypothetical protein